MFRKNLKMSVNNSRLEATKVTGKHSIGRESSCVRKEIDIDILVTFRNGDREIMHLSEQ